MKNLLSRFFVVLCVVTACAPPAPEEVTLYQSKAFTLTNYGVNQGNYQARFISSSEIRSNYFNEPRELSFKFSINGDDNEMGYGIDHHLMIYPNENGLQELPLIEFGKQFVQDETLSNRSLFLEPNTKVIFHLDMNPVFEAITKHSFYQAANGKKITEIHSISILGSAFPLDWNFPDGNNQLRDETGDGIYSITLTFNPTKTSGNERIWKLENDISNYPHFSSTLPLVDALYYLSLDELEKLRTDTGVWDTGAKWSGVWTRDMSYAFLLSLAYLDAETAKACLREKVKNERIIQDTGTGGSWPISTDRMTWALAAWEIYAVTGDKSWLEESYTVLLNSVQDDFKTIISPDGLIYGETSFADWREQSYPEWMQPVDIFTSEAADNAMVHARSWQILSEMAKIMNQDSLSQVYAEASSVLKERINETFWLEDRGFYAQYTYGRPFPLISEKPMALAESFSILFQIADKNQAKKVLAQTPVVDFGIPVFYPQIPDKPAYHNNAIWPFVQAFWNWAAADAKNEDVLTHGLASLYRASALFLTNKENFRADNGMDYPTETNSDRQLWSVAGNLAMVYRVFYGMRFSPEGIHFQPAVPKAYSGKKVLKNFKYRNADLDIEIEGFGATIQQFSIDGIEQNEFFFDGNLSGKHRIKIVLDNQVFSNEAIHLVANEFSLPTPELQVTATGLEWKPIADVAAYQIFRNGEIMDTVSETSVRAKKEYVVAEYQVRALSNERMLHSFVSEPVSLTYPNSEIWIEAERYGNREWKGVTGYRGYGFLKIGIDENEQKSVKMLVYPNLAGEYWLDFRYANGNGPINTENKAGIRTLYVNNTLIGSVVFPQRGTNEWSNWGLSNRRKINLKTGRNTVELRYEDSNANMNGEINGFWLDAMRLVRTQ